MIVTGDSDFGGYPPRCESRPDGHAGDVAVYATSDAGWSEYNLKVKESGGRRGGRRMRSKTKNEPAV